MSDSAVNISEGDVIDYINFSCVSPASERNLISFSHCPSQKSCSVLEHNLINIESVPASPVPSESGKQDKSIPGKSSVEYSEFVKVLKENEKLNRDLEEKLAAIENLQETCKDLEVCLQDAGSDALKVILFLYTLLIHSAIYMKNLNCLLISGPPNHNSKCWI